MFGGMLLTPEFLPLEGLRRVIWPLPALYHKCPHPQSMAETVPEGQGAANSSGTYGTFPTSPRQMKLQQKQGKTAAYISSSQAEFYCCFSSASANAHYHGGTRIELEL